MQNWSLRIINVFSVKADLSEERPAPTHPKQRIYPAFAHEDHFNSSNIVYMCVCLCVCVWEDGVERLRYCFDRGEPEST